MMMACSKKNSTSKDRTPTSVAPSLVYEKFVDDRLTLTLPHEGLGIPPTLVNVQVSYTGKKGLKKVFKENENLVLDLIRTKIASFSLKELKKSDDLTRFENELLQTLNGFIAKDMFIKVQVLKIREI